MLDILASRTEKFVWIPHQQRRQGGLRSRKRKNRNPPFAEGMVFNPSPSKRIKLITSAAKYAFDNDKTEVLYMVDSDAEREPALAVGFAVTGFYKGYKVERAKWAECQAKSWIGNATWFLR